MSTSARPSDLVRQIGVLSAVSFMLVAAMVGTGLLGGTAVQDLQGGALDADASFLAPARPAFSIWSVIYLGLIGYAIWQALPRQRASARQRATGWPIALTAVLNGLWLVAAQFTTLPVTAATIALLVVALGFAFRRAVHTREFRGGLLDSVLIDGVTGLHLGWVTLATVANISAWLTVIGPAQWSSAADAWGIVVLVVVGAVGVTIAVASGGRVTPGLAIGWGLVWLALGRLFAEPHSTPIGIVALIVAVVVGVGPLAVAGLRLLRPSGD